MNTKHLAPLLLTTLIGCASAPRPMPIDVAIMPDDCANRSAIARWIESQDLIPRQSFQSEQDYARQRSQIRHRLWTLRYNCQPV